MGFFLWVLSYIYSISTATSFRLIIFHMHSKWSTWTILFDVLAIYSSLVVKILFEPVEIDIKIRACGFFKR